MITNTGDAGHWVAVGEYASDNLSWTAGSTQHWDIAFDESPYGTTANIAGTVSTSTATSVYSMTTSDSISLKNTWSFERAGDTPYGTSAWWHARVQFTVDDPAGVAYSLSGFAYNSAGSTEFQVVLQDILTANAPFASRHE